MSIEYLEKHIELPPVIKNKFDKILTETNINLKLDKQLTDIINKVYIPPEKEEDEKIVESLPPPYDHYNIDYYSNDLSPIGTRQILYYSQKNIDMLFNISNLILSL